ncbi:MAG TPA: hypothetical protein VLB45_03850 [Nitrosopumilaceae archaeon]|nr:hypothetical protein [Nitrosopumilaceae archaeon]
MSFINKNKMKTVTIVIMITFFGLFVTGTGFQMADAAGPSKRLHLTVLEPTGQPSFAFCKVITDVDTLPQFATTTKRGTIHFVVSSTSTIAFVTCSSPTSFIDSFPIPLPVHTNRVTISLITP